MLAPLASCFVDCRIRQIGKPLFHKSAGTYWGMWLKDSKPHEELGQKFWLTRHMTGKTLYFYNSLENVKKDEPDGSYELTELYFGTDNVVYNGFFYYHRAGYNEIVKYDLVNNETAAKTEIPLAAYQASRSLLYIVLFVILLSHILFVQIWYSYLTGIVGGVSDFNLKIPSTVLEKNIWGHCPKTEATSGLG